MSTGIITVLLLHGAFAESASWNPVISRLRTESFDVVAVANPLRRRRTGRGDRSDPRRGRGGPVSAGDAPRLDPVRRVRAGRRMEKG